ncbi:uncharacterized protein MKK02DRAFT_38070 [Dioszegia hungarica]|uniref:Uncharacterized protein n=1 Tax=Dioszegia hungarica TaxID=4972 RepID=A0AA38H826_9TREE|nr:uncharacterized protein MKK02DRAFT_38070 [Dioszegia hungarica]KAI9634541.1 hypothetical protein MKK02DRAFT_38070 [Dioszegia hungarica]
MSSAIPSPSSGVGYPVQSVQAAQVDNADTPPGGLRLPVIVGIVITSVFVIVALIVGRYWLRHRRAKAGRQDARHMREIGREQGGGEGGAWAFETAVQSAPPMVERHLALPTASSRGNSHRGSTSTWADDSEMDMMATDGSTIARTLSTRSTSSVSTIRTTNRDTLDHPGYTYPTRSAFSTLPSVGRSNSSRSPHTLISPFSDPSPTSTTLSPFADTHTASSSTTLPRAPSRVSTVSSENPFQDPLPVYSLEAQRLSEVLSPFDVPIIGQGGLERQLQRPPPAYVERDRGAR